MCFGLICSLVQQQLQSHMARLLFHQHKAIKQRSGHARLLQPQSQLLSINSQDLFIQCSYNHRYSRSSCAAPQEYEWEGARGHAPRPDFITSPKELDFCRTIKFCSASVPPDMNICQCFTLWDIIIADFCMFDELRFHNELISV